MWLGLAAEEAIYNRPATLFGSDDYPLDRCDMTDQLRPCLKCGATGRNAKGECKTCVSVYNAAYRAKHADELKMKQAAYRAANPEKIKAVRAASYWKNPEKAKADASAWVAANPERVRIRDAAWSKANPQKRQSARDAWNKANPGKTRAAIERWRKANLDARNLSGQNYRAKKMASGTLSPGLANKLLKLQRGRCACCKKLLGDDYHLDHVIPIARQGSNTDENIQLLCPTCNCSKGAKYPSDFMRSRGFLL